MPTGGRLGWTGRGPRWQLSLYRPAVEAWQRIGWYRVESVAYEVPGMFVQTVIATLSSIDLGQGT